jgi:hypothetical protein
MNAGPITRPDRVRTMWLGTATMAVITILAAIARKSAGADAAVVVAGIYGVGVLAIAWLTSRTTSYPRWSWFAAAGINVVAIVVAAVLFPSPSQVKTWMSTAWMYPWLFLVFSSTPGPATGRCAPSGRLLLVVSVAYAVILLGACFLAG